MRQIYWLLSTSFTNVEILILALTSLLIKVGQKSQITKSCISYAKGYRGNKVIPRRNQTDISNTICGRKTKTRFMWAFRGNVFMKAFFKKFQNQGTSCEGLCQKCPKYLKVNVHKRLIFRGKLCKNQYICKFVSPLVHEIRVLVLFDPILGCWRYHVGLKLQNFEKRFHKWIIHLKVPFTFDFHLSINIGTWNTNLDILTHFWVDYISTGSQNFKILA